MFNELTNNLSKEVSEKSVADTSKEFDKRIEPFDKRIEPFDKRIEPFDKRIELTDNEKDLSNLEDNYSFDARIETSKENDLKNKSESIENSDADKKEYQNRIDLAQSSNGEWSGEVGESTLTLSTGEKIEYQNGYPKFDEFSQGNVTIDMTSDKDKNWLMAKEEYAKKWSKEKKDDKDVWTTADVVEYKKNNNLVFHECEDMKTCQLIPENIHKNAKHSGGRHECKTRGL